MKKPSTMNTPIVLGWKFWKNRRILTLESNHPSIASCPDIICSMHYKDGLMKLKYTDSTGEEVCIDGIRQDLFTEMLKIVIRNTKDEVINRIIFCRQGLDIEFREAYVDTTRYQIMEFIQRSIKNIFSDVEVKFKRIN
jgi:hypothetical protein